MYKLIPSSSKAGFTRYDKLQRSIAATNCTDISLYLGVSTRNDLSSNIFSIKLIKNEKNAQVMPSAELRGTLFSR